MRISSNLFPVLALAIVAAPISYAHRYIPNDGTHNSPEQAIVIEDPTVSQVVYHDIGEDQQNNLWIALEPPSDQSLFVQSGVPRLDRLEDYRPAVALVGPGLPEVALPFDIPVGLGARVLDTSGATPREFDEEFTGTESWILLEQTESLPEQGTYYVVAYDPAGEGGKMYVAIGQREVFGFEDILSFADVVDAVRTFHEVNDEPRGVLTKLLVAISRILQFFVSWSIV